MGGLRLDGMTEPCLARPNSGAETATGRSYFPILADHMQD